MSLPHLLLFLLPENSGALHTRDIRTFEGSVHTMISPERRALFSEVASRDRKTPIRKILPKLTLLAVLMSHDCGGRIVAVKPFRETSNSLCALMVGICLFGKFREHGERDAVSEVVNKARSMEHLLNRESVWVLKRRPRRYIYTINLSCHRYSSHPQSTSHPHLIFPVSPPLKRSTVSNSKDQNQPRPSAIRKARERETPLLRTHSSVPRIPTRQI